MSPTGPSCTGRSRAAMARIIADPLLALDAIMHQQSTFTRGDLARFAHRHSDGIDTFNEVMGAMRNTPDLIDRWDRDRQASPDRSRIILTHTNDEVRALNQAARERMREAGDLGEDVRVTVERDSRHFASGDRVMLLRNERSLGVKNGTLGTLEQVSAQSMSVRIDDGRSIAFEHPIARCSWVIAPLPTSEADRPFVPVGPECADVARNRHVVAQLRAVASCTFAPGGGAGRT